MTDNEDSGEDKTVKIKKQNRKVNTSFQDLCPVPKAKLKSKETNRKKEHSKIMTFTPLKEDMEKKEKNKKRETVYCIKKKLVKETMRDLCIVCGSFGVKGIMVALSLMRFASSC